MITNPVKSTAKLFMSSFKRMMEEDGLMVAGHISFTAFLALFPFLIFLAALAGFLSAPEDVPHIIDMMFQFMPKEVAEAMAPAVHEVITAKPAGLLTFGFVATLWAASSGVESLRIALNRAYKIKKKRPLWKRRFQSLIFIFVGAFTIFFMSLMVLFGPVIWNIISPLLHFGIVQEIVFDLSRYLSAILILVGALLVLHRFLPHREQKTDILLPGVLFTAVVFMIGGTFFSAYIANFSNYSVTYGSLGSIVITLIFFYMTAILFIFGGYLNAEIKK